MTFGEWVEIVIQYFWALWLMGVACLLLAYTLEILLYMKGNMSNTLQDFNLYYEEDTNNVLQRARAAWKARLRKAKKIEQE